MKVLRNLSLPVLLLLNFVCSAQTSKFNYDRHMIGMAGQYTYYHPKKPDKDSFQFDKGGVSSDFLIFYQWKKKYLYTPFLGWQTRMADFQYPGRFQTTDNFITAGFLRGSRLYIVDHGLFADFNFGVSVRKLLKRRYVTEFDDPNLLSRLPVNKSFGNSITASLVIDLKLHFELKGKGSTLFMGIFSTTDILKLGNSSSFNEFTRKYNSASLSIGFTSF